LSKNGQRTGKRTILAVRQNTKTFFTNMLPGWIDAGIWLRAFTTRQKRQVMRSMSPLRISVCKKSAKLDANKYLLTISIN
jgi:hypothetical protein